MDGQDFQNANVSPLPSVAKDISTIVSFEVIECFELSGSLENGIVSGMEYYLSTRRFSCNSGFALVGYRFATCMANFEWSVPLPKCTKTSLRTR